MCPNHIPDCLGRIAFEILHLPLDRWVSFVGPDSNICSSLLGNILKEFPFAGWKIPNDWEREASWLFWYGLSWWLVCNCVCVPATECSLQVPESGIGSFDLGNSKGISVCSLKKPNQCREENTLTTLVGTVLGLVCCGSRWIIVFWWLCVCQYSHGKLDFDKLIFFHNTVFPNILRNLEFIPKWESGMEFHVTRLLSCYSKQSWSCLVCDVLL